MTTEKRKYLLSWGFSLLVLFSARILSEIFADSTIFVTILSGTVQTALYTGIVVCWSVSVRRRLVQPRILKIHSYISGLVIFWHLARGIKYFATIPFDNMETVSRYLWYSYYFAMLFLSALLLMIAFSLRKPENYRLPKKTILALLSVSAVLFLLVITNDLHQLVFVFPEDAVVFTDREYSYGALYFLYPVWITGGATVFFAVTLKSCRLPNKRVLWLPIIPVVLCLVYGVLFLTGKLPWSNPDFNVAYSFSLVAILEMAITVGLIPSNNHYAELFRVSDRSGLITDESFEVVYVSENAEPIETGILQRVIEQGSVTKGGKRINYSRIRGGYIFWQDDITRLLEANEKLEGTREELRSYGSFLDEENKQKKRRQKLIEKQLLYENIRRITEPQQRLLSELAQSLEQSTDRKHAETLLHKITVIGAYIKRRSNLCLLASKASQIPITEAELCIKESITYLKLSGISAAARFELSGVVACETACMIYDFFEHVIELTLDTLKAITVFTGYEDDRITVRLIVCCDGDMNTLQRSYPEAHIEQDGDTWFCSLTANEGEIS